MAGRHHSLEPLAPHIDLYHIVREHVAGNVGQADGTLGGLLQDHRGQALALRLVIGHHGAAGDPADAHVPSVNLHAGPHHAPIQQGDGLDALGQHGQIPEIPIQDGLVGLRLLFQGRPAHIIALLLREAHGKLGQRHSENGDLAAIWGQAHLMAIKGQPRLQPQGIPGAQARGLGPQLHQPVPQPGGVGAVDEQLIPQRFPGIAGLGHPHGFPLQLQGVQGVFHGLGNGLAAGHL